MTDGRLTEREIADLHAALDERLLAGTTHPDLLPYT
jgi:hypothetical protein